MPFGGFLNCTRLLIFLVYDLGVILGGQSTELLALSFAVKLHGDLPERHIPQFPNGRLIGSQSVIERHLVNGKSFRNSPAQVNQREER